MTDKEKAIVMAYTGVAMLTGEKFSIFHKYIEDIMERPVFTHELASKLVCEQIKEKSRNDFLRLCKEERPTGEWIIGQTMDCHSDIINTYTCPFCGAKEYRAYPFCHCGADMRGGRR